MSYVQVLCASGFQRMEYAWDPEYLLSPTTGPAKLERAAMEESFPVNYDKFQVRDILVCICSGDNYESEYGAELSRARRFNCLAFND